MNIHKMNQIAVVILVLGLCSGNSIAKDSWSFGKTLGIAGLVTACVGGIAMAVDTVTGWLTTSNEEIIANARTDLSLCGKYEPLLVAIKDGYGIGRQEWLANNNWVQERLDEALLYSIACTVLDKSGPSGEYLVGLKQFVSTLKMHKKILEKRIKKLQAEQRLEYVVARELDSMLRVLDDVNGWTVELQAAQDYVDRHAAYFDLFFYESKMSQKYGPELHVFSLYAHDNYRLSQELSLIIQDRFRGYSYPCIAYVAKLDAVIRRLQEKRSAVTVYYANRLAWVDQLINTFSRLRVLCDAWYHQECLVQERNEMEKERLRLFEQQNAQLRRENDLREKALKLQQMSYLNNIGVQDQLHVTVTLPL